jgi:glycosyltransferase involved in cell wall biosynthesis
VKGIALVTKGRARLRPLVREMLRGYRAVQRELARCADAVIALSEAEASILKRTFGARRVRVCPVGVEPGPAVHAPPRDSVLCVALFSERKNQLALIRAVRDVPLVFVGGPAPFYEWYYEQCRRAAGKNVEFLGRLGYRDLAAQYAAAKVHALPSHWEAAGMSSLEAAAAGCNVVVGDVPPVREYFGERAWYCRPTGLRSIGWAVADALAAPRDSRRAGEWVGERYSARECARRVLRVYEEVLGAV